MTGKQVQRDHSETNTPFTNFFMLKEVSTIMIAKIFGTAVIGFNEPSYDLTAAVICKIHYSATRGENLLPYTNVLVILKCKTF